MHENTEHQLRDILGNVLGLSKTQTQSFTSRSGLFGHLPELDSMAVVGLLSEIEDRFDVIVHDDELDGERLTTFGALVDFVEQMRRRTAKEASDVR